jgi:hypothetical protein
MYYHFYPEEFIVLQQELKKHPEILAKLEHCENNADAYGIIAAELGILLDGVYEPIDLARMLIVKLRERSNLILTLDPQLEKLIPITAKEGPDSITIELAQRPEKKQEEK